MPRILLGTQQTAGIQLSSSTVQVSALSTHAIEARLRQKRSQNYLTAIGKLDTGGHVCSQHDVDALLAAMRAEFPEISIDRLPIGIVSKCYLGMPFEVHTLDRIGQIIRHYKIHEPLPDGLERARGLARHPAYAFVEVYSDRMIAVADNGDTSTLQGSKA